MQILKRLLIVIATLLVSGACTHSIHMVHVGGFSPYHPKAKGKIVTSREEQKTIMGFVKSTDYVDRAYEALKKQCKQGELTGITTQFSTSHGFFSWTNKILMQGLCVG